MKVTLLIALIFSGLTASAMEIPEDFPRSENFVDAGYGGLGRLMQASQLTCDQGQITQISLTNSENQTLIVDYTNRGSSITIRSPLPLGLHFNNRRLFPPGSSRDQIWSHVRGYFARYQNTATAFTDQQQTLYYFLVLQLSAGKWCENHPNVSATLNIRDAFAQP